MTKAKSIMLQGTGSGVGKSVLVSAFCRILLQDGYLVAPFKSQNMALNSFVTESGGEIGRAQAAQAQAAKIKPSVDMNPVLLKPTADRSAQVIVMGKALKNMSVYEYKKYKEKVFKKVEQSFNKLSREYELVVIEGAGSPAEVNLREDDIVNMRTAAMTDSPVILIGDIDKGGVFAWIIGTLQLLTENERKRVKGLIINKFRGDKRLLRSGITYLEKYTGIKVLGVVPYYHDIKIPEEDSVPLEYKAEKSKGDKKINVNVIYLPHISNFTDFDALAQEEDVNLNYINDPIDLKDSDLIIIPGSKSTISDLKYLKKSGLAQAILKNVLKGSSVFGVCGGYQMLGDKICDNLAVESLVKETLGLALLPVITNFASKKHLSQVNAEEILTGAKLRAYEIHHGKTKIKKGLKHLFKVNSNGKIYYDGVSSHDGKCMGTYLHGVFDNDVYRNSFLNRIRKIKQIPLKKKSAVYNVDKEFDKLATLVRKNINMKLFYEILMATK